MPVPASLSGSRIDAPRGLARRDALRLGLLGVGLVGGVGTLAACSDSDDPSSDSDGSSDGIDLVSSDVKRAAGDPSVLSDVVDGLGKLAGGLYGGAAEEPGNVVLSPYSVLVALGMTLAGAAGTTATEMRDVIGARGLGDRWHKGVNALTGHIDGLAGKKERSDDSEAEIALATANQIFGQRDVAWEESFLDLLAKEYGAALRAVDFQEAEDARSIINDWVEEQTEDRIEDLIPEGVLDAMTRLVLVNAIYLKAPWEDPFEKSLTEPATFTRGDGSEVRVDTMRKSDLSATLTAGDDWRAATIPYAGRELAMTVVLPEPDRMDAVEQSLASAGPAPFLAGGQSAKLDMRLPKWSFRSDVGLKDLLIALGMPTAFGNDADFTAMTEEDLDLAIADALHQGFIAVDEEGTEAAAATAVVVGETAVPITESFVVDRPFLFVIHDIEHAAPLFVGRVSDPAA